MRPSFFYGYVILALCFFNMFFMRGIIGSFGVFYVALLEDFAWSSGTIASIASVNALVYALSSPLVGWAFDRLGPRILMPLGGGLMGIGLFLAGTSDSLWELYLYYGVVFGMGVGGLGFVSNSALISHWFRRRRGVAIGLATMGLGLGILILVPLTQILISEYGWRSAFMILAGLILCTSVPINALFQRRYPEEMGQIPDGHATQSEDYSGEFPKRPLGTRQWTLKDALRSYPYWSITGGHLVLGAGLSMLYTHLVAYLVNEGIDKLTAAFILGLVGLTRIPGTILWGLVSDRLGRDKAYAIATFLTLAGIVCLIKLNSSTSHWYIYTFAILFGVGHSAGNLTYGSTIADIFGGSTVGTILGFLEISFGMGMAFGPWFGGFIYDITGSYRWAFLFALLTFLTSYLAVYAALSWHYRELAKRKGDLPSRDL
ncbi:MAG: MFS transporter [Candidatus Binatia bacterium]